MAYSFASASSQYLSATASSWSLPLTISARYYRTSGSATRVIASLNNTSSNGFYWLGLDADVLYAGAVGSGNNAATRTISTVNTWAHGAAVFAATNSRTAYVNGVAGTTATSSVTVSNANTVAVGARYFNSAWGVYSNDRIAEVGVWTTALTTEEIASLSNGVACRLIRPQSLVFYAPLIRNLVDVRGGLTIANNNTATVIEHPRIYA